MKNFKHFIIALFLVTGTSVFGQVQIDKAIQLTGTGANAKVTGIQEVNGSTDAVSVNALQQGGLTFANSGGSANAYTVNFTPAATGYAAGMTVSFLATFSNTGSATLNVNGHGAMPLKKNFNSNLDSADIKNGQAVVVMYDGTNFQVLTQTSSGSPGALAHGKQVFTYSGARQYFTVPTGVSSIKIKLWGAGGGGAIYGAGGGGAFVQGSLAVTPGSVLTLIVGQGGKAFGFGAYPGAYGGGGTWASTGTSGGGGGRSAVQITPGTDAAIAGGGGGGGDGAYTPGYGNGGGGGAADGADGQEDPNCADDGGKGGTTSAGGAGATGCGDAGGTGSQYQGGGYPSSGSYNPGSGGGGYYGGGAGGGNGGGGGGGGSSYVTGTGFTLTSNLAGETAAFGVDLGGVVPGTLAGNTTDIDYEPLIGDGNAFYNQGALEGGNGLIVIEW